MLKKQLFPLYLLLTSTTCLAMQSSGSLQPPQAMIPLKERLEKAVDKAHQKKAEDGSLYDATRLMKDINFQRATDDLKKQMMLDYFKSKRDNAARTAIYPFLIKEVIIFSVIMVVLIGGFIGAQKLIKVIKNWLHEEVGGGGGLDMMVDGYIYTIAFALFLSVLGFLIKSGSDTWTVLSLYYTPEELYNPMLSTLQERFAYVQWMLIRDKRHDYIKVIKSGLVNLGMDKKQYDIITKVTELLNLANIGDDNDGFLTFDEKKIDEFLIGIKPHIAKRIKEELFSIVVMVNIAKLKGIRTQYTLLLYGPPGTGKTRLARGLAKLINLPSFYVNMSSGVQGIFGIQKQKSSDLTQGIAASISHKHGSYPVAIFDDVDRDMINQPMSTSWQLEILDNAKNYYRDAFFNVNIPKPMVMIFTGNHADKLDRAAENRFSATIHFYDPLNNQGKHMALDEELDKLTEKHKGLPYSITKKDYTKDEWQSVKENAIKKAELKKDQGLRECLKYVRHHFNKKVKKKHDAILRSMKNNQKTARAA